MLLRDLQPASFRGAPFLVPRDDMEEGRNSIVHDYPDQLMRYVEDNGKIPPCFSLRAIIHGDGLPGKLNRLRAALSAPGPGVLKHPVYGTQFVAVDGTYRVTREDSNSGVIELDLKFIVTGAPVFPGLVSGIAALVTGLASSAVTRAFDAFVAQYRVPRSVASALVLADSIRDIATSLDLSFGLATTAPSRLYDRADTYARFVPTARSLFVDSFRVPFELDDLPNRDLVKGFDAVAIEAAAVSVQAAAINPTTIDRSDRQISQEAIGMFCEFAAFCSMADAMAGRAYTTGEEVEADEALLTETYGRIQARGLPAEQHADMSDIYTATSEVLRDIGVRLPRTSQIDAKNLPASVLAYMLYEQDGMNNGVIPDRLQQIVEINLNQDPCLLAKDTRVLTRVN